MRNITIWLFAAMLITFFIPTQLNASANNETVNMAETELIVITDIFDFADVLSARLEEIHTMDISAMNSSEKRELRKEVRAIEKQQRSGGIYVSTGAVILIVILLILFL
jgi:hypothetical protein